MACGAGQPVTSRRLPPVYVEGDLLVDGGALDNIPVEVMRARIGSGSVVAVDLFPEPVTAQPFDPCLSGWRVLAHRLNPLASPRPRVIDILSRATGLSGIRHQRAALASDLLLRPPLPAVGALGFKAGAALIEALKRSHLLSRFIT